MRLALGSEDGAMVEVAGREPRPGRDAVMRARDLQVVAMRAAGQHPADIAAFFNLNIGTVYRIFERVPDAATRRFQGSGCPVGRIRGAELRPGAG